MSASIERAAGFLRPGLMAALMLAGLPSAAGAQQAWQPVEQVSHYAISGKTGLELYLSIGKSGPMIGSGTRVIAHTTFRLTWRRDYRPQPDGACRLVSAIPKLVITYTVPRPRAKLGAPLAARWKTFSDGILAHEEVHGEMIVDMVREIEAASIGLTVAADPGCRRIRELLTERLGEISQAQRRRSADFDRVEMGNGGNVHQLILALVNQS